MRNMTRTLLSPVKGNEIDKNRKPYVNGKVNSVTILSDHDNQTNKKYRLRFIQKSRITKRRKEKRYS